MSTNTLMICKRCGSDANSLDLDATTIGSDLRDVECTVSHSRGSTCDPCMELANLEKFIAKLEKKRSELKRKINRTHSPFIRMIPPEIIAKISGFTNTDLTIMGGLPVPILLSSVCSDWRRTVVGTPRLWSSIKIDLPSITKSSNMTYNTFLRLATFIEEWLERSGQLPLHISLSSGHDIPDSSTLEKYRTIFKILNRYSSRWHRLNISITPTILSCLRPDHLPLLEQLSVNFPFNMRNPDCQLTLPPSPRLKEVGIHAFIHSILPPLPNIGIQWDNVTHVSAESLTIQSCFDFLRLVPQLVHCKFHNIIADAHNSSLPSSESSIISPALTYLSLSCYQRPPCLFLDKVVLPSLETLSLSNVSSVGTLMAFLERSACSLRSLSLEQLNIKEFDSLTRLLQFLSPSLTKLVISQTPRYSNEKYLSILTKTYKSQRAVLNDFLPYLEFFGYSEAFAWPPTEPFNLPKLLVARNYPKPATSIQLRSAYIDLPDRVIHQPIPHDVLSILQYLKENGILLMDSRNLLPSSAKLALKC